MATGLKRHDVSNVFRPSLSLTEMNDFLSLNTLLRTVETVFRSVYILFWSMTITSVAPLRSVFPATTAIAYVLGVVQLPFLGILRVPL